MTITWQILPVGFNQYFIPRWEMKFNTYYIWAKIVLIKFRALFWNVIAHIKRRYLLHGDGCISSFWELGSLMSIHSLLGKSNYERIHSKQWGTLHQNNLYSLHLCLRSAGQFMWTRYKWWRVPESSWSQLLADLATFGQSDALAAGFSIFPSKVVPQYVNFGFHPGIPTCISSIGHLS